MKRFILQQLIEWKNREDRKPLILNGARQVGKTWLLHEFAKLEYKKEAYVVCRKNNLARQLFSQDFNVDRILRGLRAIPLTLLRVIRLLSLMRYKISRKHWNL